MTAHYLPALRDRAIQILRFVDWPENDIETLFDLVNDRTEKIKQMYREGQTLELIGSHFGITRERVRQILRKANVDRVDGGRSKCSEKNAVRAARKRDESCMRKYGCTHAQHQMLLRLQRETEHQYRGPIRAFGQQRNSAQGRNVPFRLNLWQWWTIWQESGKWEQRGRGRGHYCMARIGDQGAYEVGNVKIIPNEENASESYEHTPADKRLGFTRDELGLTGYQRRIYDLAIHGLRNKDIANELGVTPGTVASQLVTIRKVRPEIRRAN